MFKVAPSLRRFSQKELARLLLMGLVYEHDGYLLPSISGEAAAPIWRLSGGSGNSDPAASLGGVMSTSTLAGATIFDDVSGDETAVGDVEYRGVYVLNNGSTDLAITKVWAQIITPSPDTAVAIALADEGANATMETIADEGIAPVGPAFSTPTSYSAGLSLGTLAAGQRYGVWIRRTVTSGGAAYTNDTFTLRVQGDTGA